MNLPKPPTIDDDALCRLLVAYLDGELDADAVRRIEHRAGGDEAFRGRLDAFRDTWNLLDRLPRRQGDETFTCTTVEMVALAADSDNRRSHSRRQWLGGLGGLAGIAAAAIAGFMVAAWMVDAPNRQLLRDLPVIENVDPYRHADSVEFLQALDAEGLFAAEADDDL